MSYKTTILSDYPLAYYPLDDLTTGEVPDFNDLLSQFETYQEVLDFYSSYSNMSGTTAFDYSGCNNHGVYSGAPENRILPIIPGNSMATKITDTLYVSYDILNDFYGNTRSNIIATKHSSTNAFSLEVWFSPNISSGEKTPIFADADNSVGIFYEKGNVSFNINSEEVSHTIMDTDRVIHVVAVYSVSHISLFVDGVIVSSKAIGNFVFTNTSLTMKSGPCEPEDSFLVNSIAAYSYSLPSNSIVNHYNAAIGVSPVQIALPAGGELFQIFDNSPSYEFKYSYPGNKAWSYFTNEDLSYNQSENSLSLIPTLSSESKSIVLDEYISLPVSSEMDSSKIEWLATDGILVETSLDGDAYTECVNGAAIPGYSLGNFSDSFQLHIRITFSTEDASKFIPRIKSLLVKFYSNQILNSNNGASYISTLENASGQTAFDIAIGSDYKNILFRNPRNGIKTVQDSGFYVNTESPVFAIEFFYTPDDIQNTGLINVLSTGPYSAATYRWHNTGTVTKSNVSHIYVNGTDVTSETSALNIFKPNELNHVLIVFAQEVSGQIKFADSIYGSVPSLFQNIALYPSQDSADLALSNYSIYTGGSTESVQDSQTSSILMTENSVNYYNNDRIVISSS
jgi:hypothetical protein